MTSLTDLGNVTESLNIRGKKFEVRGIPAEHVLQLLEQFPELRKLFAGKQLSDPYTFLMTQSSKVLASLIVMGLGLWSDDKEQRLKEVQAATSLTLGEQADIIRVVFSKTFPRGVTSFMEGLSTIMDSVGGEPTKAVATK